MPISALKISRNGTVWALAGNTIYQHVFDEPELHMFRKLVVDIDSPSTLLTPACTMILCRHKEAWTVNTNGKVSKWHLLHGKDHHSDVSVVDCPTNNGGMAVQAQLLYDGSVLILPDCARGKAVCLSRFLDSKRQMILGTKRDVQYIIGTSALHEMLVVVASEKQQQEEQSTCKHTVCLYNMATTISKPE